MDRGRLLPVGHRASGGSSRPPPAIYREPSPEAPLQKVHELYALAPVGKPAEARGILVGDHHNIELAVAGGNGNTAKKSGGIDRRSPSNVSSAGPDEVFAECAGADCVDNVSGSPGNLGLARQWVNQSRVG